ncbi:MAG: phospholipase D-like domain-containing protein [Spirochaetota bacterium]
MRALYSLFFLACTLHGAAVTAWFGPSSAADTNGIYRNLLSFIDTATNTIRGAVHELDLVSIAARFADARRRGVEVELCFETKNMEGRSRAALAVLRECGVRIFPDKRKSGLMHNKFLVADGVRVWTGSANFTCNDMFRNYNDCLRIESMDVAAFYTDEALSISDPVTFPAARSRERSFTLGTERIVVLFSPGGGVSYRIGETVRRANDTIRFLTFAFSSEAVLGAIAYAERRGVSVFGVFDNVFENPLATRSWRTVPFRELSERAGAVVRYDNEDAKIHHKTIICDADTVITGSFNFSLNAERNNNENVLMIRSRPLAQAYASRHALLFKRFNKPSRSEQYRSLCETTIAGGKKPVPWEVFTHECAVRTAGTLKSRITNGVFHCIIREIVSGDVMRCEVSGLDEYVVVRLAGIEAPAVDAGAGQYPQAAYARETLALIAAGETARVSIVRENGYCSFIADVRTRTNYSLAAAMASSGWVFTDTNASSMVRAAASNAKERRIGIWSERFALTETPAEFRERCHAERRARVIALDRECDTSLTDGIKTDIGVKTAEGVIGNRATRRYYLPWTSDHERVAKRISENNIVYFAHESNALAAGFIRGGK